MTYAADSHSTGWAAWPPAPWLAAALTEASTAVFGQDYLVAGQGVCQVRCSAAANPAHKNSKRQYAWCWDNKKLRQSTDEDLRLVSGGIFCFGLALMHLSGALSIFKTEGRCSDPK